MSLLRHVALNQTVILSDLTKIDDRLRRRMISLGFYEGCSVRVKRRAIFQDRSPLNKWIINKLSPSEDQMPKKSE